VAAGCSPAISLARFGPVTTATRSAPTPVTCMITWLIRMSVSSSMPLATLTSVASPPMWSRHSSRLVRRVCDGTLVSVAKGIELDTLMRMSQVIMQVTGVGAERVAVVTGPNLASEIAGEQPAATVVACADSGRAVTIQRALSTRYFRPYTNSDVVGAEVGGACKNVIALACGMAAGVGLGENTAAAIITRGLAEIMRLGIALGAKGATLAGLAGVGDLVATCSSPRSRNRALGERLGRGGTMESALAAAGGHVAEGVTSCQSVLALASSYDVEMPLTDAVHRVCHKGLSVDEAMALLLGRSTKPE
jgi:glycerol-3-phosphate dehydrogenase (NAD(P)+)